MHLPGRNHDDHAGPRSHGDVEREWARRLGSFAAGCGNCGGAAGCCRRVPRRACLAGVTLRHWRRWSERLGNPAYAADATLAKLTPATGKQPNRQASPLQQRCEWCGACWRRHVVSLTHENSWCREAAGTIGDDDFRCMPRTRAICSRRAKRPRETPAGRDLRSACRGSRGKRRGAQRRARCVQSCDVGSDRRGERG